MSITDHNASVTLTMRDYRKLSDGLHPGGVAFIACVAFGVGIVVGMTSLDNDAHAPAPRPTQVSTQVVNTPAAISVSAVHG